MNCAEIGIFKQSDEVGFSNFLQSLDGAALESEICFEILSSFSYQSLEWNLPDQKLRALPPSLDLNGEASSRRRWPEQTSELPLSPVASSKPLL